MDPKRRDNHDRYLIAAQVKALIKKTAEKEGRQLVNTLRKNGMFEKYKTMGE
ncbi:hypothetical protein [Bacillus paranthracis]|uniref:hypothetical protein n=1 Tax=Bacillus paranthracis TaxID=2026186 RepID=UPI002E229446|nr:hypothetical protein [Bacillus paranthracis]